MLTQSETLTYKRTVQAKPAEVFRAFTHAHVLPNWLSNAADLDARRGGRIYLWWDEGYYAAGVYTLFERDENLAFTWRDSQGVDSAVSVTLRPQGEGTEVIISHDGAQSSDKIATLWEEALENLQSLVETGIDLRLARRPMFGMSGGDFLTPELAEKLSIPVKEGVWLQGLVDGMGAKAAGLQKDDVVVSIGGREVANFASFVAAIQPHRAGDTVEVVFYRGPERHAVPVVLSSRPTVEPPATLRELVEKSRSLFAEVDAEIEKLFEGVTEAQAEHRTEPDGWTAKEVVAHLIAGERVTHVALAAMVEDADADFFQYYANSKERIQPMVKAYPTVRDLIEELRRTEQIVVEMVAVLPEKTVAHKDYYRQIADAATNFPDHHREHFKEIERLLAAAKG